MSDRLREYLDEVERRCDSWDGWNRGGTAEEFHRDRVKLLAIVEAGLRACEHRQCSTIENLPVATDGLNARSIGAIAAAARIKAAMVAAMGE